MDPQLAVKLRAKKLGILIRDARLSAGKSLRDCGDAIGVSGSTMGAYEKGERSPSLSELEMISYYLKIPFDHFWKDQILEADESVLDALQVEHALILRNRSIGNVLAQLRKQAGITYKEVHEKTGISPRRMKKYETGDHALSVPELELLTNTLGVSMNTFREHESVVGQWIAAQAGINEFLSLPTNVQVFVTTPVNLPYIELAEKLSNISADQLRLIAEGLLEITI
ncbi:MAG: helix-turn-helix transcriptional regulator [Chloroflexota bacterium]